MASEGSPVPPCTLSMSLPFAPPPQFEGPLQAVHLLPGWRGQCKGAQCCQWCLGAPVAVLQAQVCSQQSLPGEYRVPLVSVVELES